MGWFLPSHIDQGFIFGLLGAWHIYGTLQNYISAPDRFKSRTWFPAPGPGALRCVELWTLLFIVIAFISKQMSHASVDLASGVIHTEHLMRFQHVSFSLFFLLYIVVALIHEMTSVLPLPDGVLNGVFALGFLAELIVFHFGHHPGDNLESYVHMLMQLILFALVTMMFLEIAFPNSVIVAIGRAMLLTMKGTWFFNIGLQINVSALMPMGCVITDGDFPVCALPMDDMRAKSIQVLVLVVQAVGVVLFTFVLYAVLLGITSLPSRPGQTVLHTAEVKPLLRDLNHSVYFVVDRDGDFADAIDAAGVPILKDLPRSLSRRMSSRTSSPLPQLPLAKVLI